MWSKIPNKKWLLGSISGSGSGASLVCRYPKPEPTWKHRKTVNSDEVCNGSLINLYGQDQFLRGELQKMKPEQQQDGYGLGTNKSYNLWACRTSKNEMLLGCTRRNLGLVKISLILGFFEQVFFSVSGIFLNVFCSHSGSGHAGSLLAEGRQISLQTGTWRDGHLAEKSS